MEKKHLGDLGDIFIGLTYKPDDVSDEGMIVLRSGNIQDGNLDFDDIVRVNCSVRENLFVKPDDILMCTRNGSAKLVGKCTLLPMLPETMTFGAFMTIIRTPYNRYLRYFFDSDAFRQQMKGAATTTINQITRKMLDEVVVPMPDAEDMNRIAAVLDKVSGLIAMRKKQLQKLDDLVKARFVEMIHENKPSYVKLKDVVEEDRIITYGIVKPGEYTEGGIPIIKVKDFPNGVILMHDMLLASPEIESKYERSRVREGDLLFSIRGSVGRTAFVPKELTDANITQDTARLSISDNFSPKYVRAALEYDPVQYDISQYVRGVAVRGINLADLREIEIPVVDLALQEQFAAFVEQTDKSKLTIRQSLDKLILMKKSLMQKYFG